MKWSSSPGASMFPEIMSITLLLCLEDKKDSKRICLTLPEKLAPSDLEEDRVTYSGIWEREIGNWKDGWYIDDRGTLGTLLHMFRKVQPWRTMKNLVKNKGYWGTISSVGLRPYKVSQRHQWMPNFTFFCTVEVILSVWNFTVITYQKQSKFLKGWYKMWGLPRGKKCSVDQWVNSFQTGKENGGGEGERCQRISC